MRYSRSISAAGTSSNISVTDSAIPVAVSWASTAPAHSSAVPASTSGYRGEIGAAQLRQWPLSASHERIGTLSYGRTGVPQEVQRERGLTSDSRRGRRYVTTLRNEPNTAPITPARVASMG